MSKIRDLTGEKFGELVVLCFAGLDSAHKATFLCRCSCGKELVVRGNNLLVGGTKTCGHTRAARAAEMYKYRKLKHGYCTGGDGDRLYNIWKTMVSRCNNKLDKDYSRYGGRGIVVCDEWLDVKEFHNWAEANGYSNNLQLDRIDNYKGYSPDNCRWVSAKQQQRNKRNTNMILNRPVMDWVDILVSLGDKYDAARVRIEHRLARGWDEYLAVFTPPLPSGYRTCMKLASTSL